MGFADSLLSTGERVIHREKQHWFVFVWGARLTLAAALVAIVFMVVVSGMAQEGFSGTVRDILGWITVILLVGALLNLGWTILRYINQEYLITNRRVLQVSGVLNKSSTDSSLEKINDAVLTQSIFGRIFGFGDLDVLTAADVGIDRFKMIVDPIGFKKAMLDAKHEFEVDMERQGWPPTPPARASDPSRSSSDGGFDAETATTFTAPALATAAAPAPSAASPRGLSPDEVTRTLSNLADLRDRGAITLEEYEAKKDDLLGRL
jgi:hypothetical protein